jgi:predicted nucleic acid-binding protein
MAVLDASVLSEYLAGGEHAAQARRWMLEDAGRLWAPHLIDAEVGHVLRRAEARGELSARTARAALADLAELPLLRVAHVGLLDRAWALRRNVSFYDGLYVALAERTGETLLTLDARLAAAASGLLARIELVA